MEAAKRRGYAVERIRGGREGDLTGLGFIRPHAIPEILRRNQLDWVHMSCDRAMVQDFRQIGLYDDKSLQFYAYKQWMPKTWLFEDKAEANEFAKHYPTGENWIVSKANEGASSKNVRIIKTTRDLMLHCGEAFRRGIKVDHCAGGHEGKHSFGIQKGYVLLQEYIPHNITWRVNAIGRGRAMFKRYCGKGTLTAQTGNVEPVMSLDDDVAQRVYLFAEYLFDSLKTKWCALDILHDPRTDDFYLLESSVGWPWPSPGTCMDGVFFGNIGTPRRWAEMWDLMLDEYEAGVWTAEPTGPSTTCA
jgi:hypothetical protein